MLKRRKFSHSERDFILQRANGCCEYCLIPYDFTPETFENEHIIPLFLNGTNEMSNLAFACGGCNGKKNKKTSAIDTLTGLLVSLYNPREDIWAEHFKWQEGFLILEGITPKGRASVDLLKLNRRGIVNLRSALYLIGVHPPKF